MSQEWEAMYCEVCWQLWIENLERSVAVAMRQRGQRTQIHTYESRGERKICQVFYISGQTNWKKYETCTQIHTEVWVGVITFESRACNNCLTCYNTYRPNMFQHTHTLVLYITAHMRFYHLFDDLFWIWNTTFKCSTCTKEKNGISHLRNHMQRKHC